MTCQHAFYLPNRQSPQDFSDTWLQTPRCRRPRRTGSPAAAPDLALVDIPLAAGPTRVSLARRLAQAGIAAVFMTANLKRIPLDDAGAIGKPYAPAGVAAALAHVAVLRGGATPAAPSPRSLIMAPAI